MGIGPRYACSLREWLMWRSQGAGMPRAVKEGVCIMKRRCLCTCLATAIICCSQAVGLPLTVDFESVALGTKYGADYGNTPGEPVFTQDGIVVSVDNFYLSTFVGFIRAEVGGAYAVDFPTTPLELDNISVAFDFTGLGFDVTNVTLEYREFGGADNFSVNGQTLYQLDALTDLPALVAPGINASVIEQDSIALTAAAGYHIDGFLIGGQELGVDTIVAIPEPTSALLLALAGVGALTLQRARHRQRARRL